MSDRITMLSSFNEPDTVEMMDDDDSSSSSSSSESDDDFKSANSNTKKAEKKGKLKKLNKNHSNDDDDDDDDDEDEDDDDDLDSKTNKICTTITTTATTTTTTTNSTTEIAMHTEYSEFKSVFTDANSGIADENLLSEEDEERRRFQIELEFVQSLANPSYLNFLAQRGYFRQQTFLNYLKYLMYWKQPDYVKYIMYPQCLSLLELLQHEQFLKEIVNAQCSKFIDEQLLLIWSTYKKKRDWIRIDPTKIPDGIEKLFANENSKTTAPTSKTDSTTILTTTNILNEDTFSAEAFLANEKF